jgi:hypothetical protein
MGMGIPTSHKSIPRMTHLQNIIYSPSTPHPANRSAARELLFSGSGTIASSMCCWKRGSSGPLQSHLEKIRQNFTPQLRRPSWL